MTTRRAEKLFNGLLKELPDWKVISRKIQCWRTGGPAQICHEIDRGSQRKLQKFTLAYSTFWQKYRQNSVSTEFIKQLIWRKKLSVRVNYSFFSTLWCCTRYCWPKWHLFWTPVNQFQFHEIFSNTAVSKSDASSDRKFKISRSPPVVCRLCMYRKFTCTLFWQKFRESNVSTE